MTEIVTPSEAAWKRIVAATKRVEAMPLVGMPRSGRRQPIVGGGSGVSTPCQDQWRILMFGNPTGGSVIVNVTANSVTESVSFSYNATVSSLTTALEGHSEIASGDVEVEFYGGAFPTHECTIKVLNPGLDLRFGIPAMSLTGGTNPFIHLRKCCG